MTEQEWITCDDWRPMLAFVDGRTTPKQRTLYLAAGLRELWPLLYADGSRFGVELGERVAFGLATEQELEHIRNVHNVTTFDYDSYRRTSDRHFQQLLELGVYVEKHDPGQIVPRYDVNSELLNQVVSVVFIAEKVPYVDLKYFDDDLLHFFSQLTDWPGGWLVREVFGNPFRTVEMKPAWQTETVRALTHGIIAGRAFDRLPVLADALEEAGCDAHELLSHLRSSDQHVLGCWALDRVLDER